MNYRELQEKCIAAEEKALWEIDAIQYTDNTWQEAARAHLETIAVVKDLYDEITALFSEYIGGLNNEVV